MNILLTGNLVFIKLDTRNTFVDGGSNLYMASSINGGLFPAEIYTYEDIKKQNPEIQELKDFHQLVKAWGTKL